MPKSFSKVHKHVAKKKGAKPTALHENSRDSRSLIRASNRDQRVLKTETLRQRLNLPYLNRMLFVQMALFGGGGEQRDAADGDVMLDEAQENGIDGGDAVSGGGGGDGAVRCYAIEEIQDVIETYLDRDSEELEQVRAARRPGRPASGREDVLKTLQTTERREYESGFWMPDLLGDEANVKTFSEWKGEWIGLNVVKFVRITQDGQVKASAWPPKGNS